MKRILIVSHCILNTASKVAMDENELREEYELRNKLLKLVMEQNIQLIQLPCPEFRIYGSRRWGHVKNQFSHPHYKKECRKMLDSVLEQLEEYLAYPEDYEVLGIVSVEGSPSCGYRKTCIGEWGGELSGDTGELMEIQKTCRAADEPGVFMEVLEEELQKNAVNISIMSMEEAVELLSSK